MMSRAEVAPDPAPPSPPPAPAAASVKQANEALRWAPSGAAFSRISSALRRRGEAPSPPSPPPPPPPPPGDEARPG